MNVGVCVCVRVSFFLFVICYSWEEKRHRTRSGSQSQRDPIIDVEDKGRPRSTHTTQSMSLFIFILESHCPSSVGCCRNGAVRWDTREYSITCNVCIDPVAATQILIWRSSSSRQYNFWLRAWGLAKYGPNKKKKLIQNYVEEEDDEKRMNHFKMHTSFQE